MRIDRGRKRATLVQFVLQGAGLSMLILCYMMCSGRLAGGSLRVAGLVIGMIGLALQGCAMYSYYQSDWRLRGGAKELIFFLLGLAAVVVIPLVINILW